MNPDKAVQQIRALRGEAAGLPTSKDSTEFTAWNARSRTVLTAALGEQHHITQEFVRLRWTPSAFFGDDSVYPRAFARGRQRAEGLLDAAVAELESMPAETPAVDESEVDPELWAHVVSEVQAGAWGKVASQAVIFTEDRIRKWAGRPVGEVGKDLAIAIFGANGQFRMGKTEGESQGWQLFAQGIAQALRNVDAHRIQDRPDHKRYALGLVGACSLLLTQLRYEHGNRFRDTTAAAEPAPIAQ